MLAGGGARGAYEVGALAALAPALAMRGEAPDIIVGTSIGALNGAFFAARAHEPLEVTAAAGVEMWRELRWGDALQPLVSPSELGRLLGAGAMLAGLPGADLSGLLDPSPLRDTLGRLVAFEQIARNVKGGALTAAAVVATAYATTRSVVFHHGGPALGLDSMHAIDYVETPIAPEHVLASAAIPGAFPAVEITAPARGGGLVRRRWRASERAARTGARARRRPRRRDRLELLGDACQVVSAAGRDRRRRTATAGRARRSARRQCRDARHR